MNNKGLIATIVGVILAAMLTTVGTLWSQVNTNRAEISALNAKVDLAVDILKEIREELRGR